MALSRGVRVGLVVSVLWLFGWSMFALYDAPDKPAGGLAHYPGWSNEVWVQWAVFTFSPLLLGWGIWWIRKPDK